MIEIKCENELIQFDIIDRSDKDIHCSVYFTKFDCKFASKDIVIRYDALKKFHSGLKQVLTNAQDDCLLTDSKGVISLKIHKDKDNFPDLRENDDFNRLIEFEFFYYAGSDMSLSGYLFVDDISLTETIKEIEALL